MHPLSSYYPHSLSNYHLPFPAPSDINQHPISSYLISIHHASQKMFSSTGLRNTTALGFRQRQSAFISSKIDKLEVLEGEDYTVLYTSYSMLEMCKECCKASFSFRMGVSTSSGGSQPWQKLENFVFKYVMLGIVLRYRISLQAWLVLLILCSFRSILDFLYSGTEFSQYIALVGTNFWNYR